MRSRLAMKDETSMTFDNDINVQFVNEEDKKKYKNVKSIQELAALDDEVDEIVNFDEAVESNEAMVILNGQYPATGFDHQDAAELALSRYKIIPKSESRGFIDKKNKVAFLITWLDEGSSFIDYLQGLAEDRGYTKNTTVVKDFKLAAQVIKKELNVKKVYTLYTPKMGQAQRLAKLIK